MHERVSVNALCFGGSPLAEMEAIWQQLAPLAGEEDRYAMASRDSRETTEKVLRAEMARIAAEEAEEERERTAHQKSKSGRVERPKERV